MGAERHRRLQLLILLGAALPSCARVDLGQPVVLVPAADVDAETLETLAAAAESWNLELGTELLVGESGPQRVRVERSDLICAFGGGLTRYAGGVDVQICSGAAKFWVLLHELGHVVNIRDHASRSSAAMSVPGSGGFDEEDRALFVAANPGFTGKGGCQVIRRLGPSPWLPFPFRSPRGPVAVTLEGGDLSVQLLEESTAASKQRGARLGDGKVGQWAHFPTPGGLGVVWAGESEAHLQLVDGQTLEASPPVALGTGALKVNERVLGGARQRGDALLLLIVTGDELELRRYELATGRPLGAPVVAGAGGNYGELVEAGGRLLLARVPRTLSSVIELAPIDADGVPGQAIAVPGLSSRICDEGCPWPFFLGSGDEVLIATGAAGGVQVTAISASTLEVTRTVQLAGPPGTDIPGFLELLPTARGLVLTLSVARPGRTEAEAYVRLIDAGSLGARGAWRRLSQPQGKPDQFPRAVETAEGAIVVWVQGELGASSEAIARCVSF